MKIGQEFGQNLTCSPIGRETDAGQGVDRYLVDRLTARFPTPDPIPAAGLIELIVSQLQWELDYESAGSSAYSLSSSVEVRAVEAGGSSPVTLRSHRCSEKAQETHSLDEWHADDNAAIRHVADALAEKCFRTTLMALGIEYAASGERVASPTPSSARMTVRAHRHGGAPVRTRAGRISPPFFSVVPSP